MQKKCLYEIEKCRHHVTQGYEVKHLVASGQISLYYTTKPAKVTSQGAKKINPFEKDFRFNMYICVV